MNRKPLLLSILMCLCGAIQMQAQKFNEAQLKNFEQRVKHYCSLLEDFSSSTDGVLVMDELKACCENENVSTFDDLLADNRQVEYNSVPLSGYLMKITSKFDHKLKVSYSNFKYESCVTHPALLKELDDITYARFSCTKTIKGKGLSKKLQLVISLNVDNNKVGGTVSSEFEDPGKMLQNAIQAQQDGKMDEYVDLLQKCASYKQFPGRYRAMAMLGKHFSEQKEYPTAISWLKKSADHDPLAGIILAGVYMDKDLPYKLRDSFEALRLLGKYSENKDKDYPEYQILAQMWLVNAYSGNYTLPANAEKAKAAIKRGFEICRTSDLELAKHMYPIFKLANLTLAAQEEDFNTLMKVFEDYEKEIDRLYPESGDVLAKHFRSYNLVMLHKMRGQTYWNNNDFDNSLKSYNKALAACDGIYVEKEKKKTQYDIEKNIAKLYLHFKKYDQALECYRGLWDKWKYSVAAFYLYEYYSTENELPGNATEFEKYISGNHGQKDDKQANDFLFKAAVNGCLDAQYLLSAYTVLQTDILEHQKFGLETFFLRFCDRCRYDDDRALRLMGTLAGKLRKTDGAQLFDLIKSKTDESGSANCILALYYGGLNEKAPNRDRKKYVEYWTKGAQLHHFFSSFFLAQDYLMQKTKEDTIKAKEMVEGMMNLNYHAAFSLNGEIEECEGNYSDAMKDYQIAYDLGYAYVPEILADRYAEGRIVKKDIAKAIAYYEEGYTRALEADNEDVMASCKQKIAKLREENPSLAASANESSVAALLSSIADISKSPDDRLDLSQNMLRREFASAEAVVEQVGTNGTTVVAKLTAEDFLLQLATQSRRLTVKVIDAKRDGKGKLTFVKVSY